MLLLLRIRTEGDCGGPTVLANSQILWIAGVRVSCKIWHPRAAANILWVLLADDAATVLTDRGTGYELRTETESPPRPYHLTSYCALLAALDGLSRRHEADSVTLYVILVPLLFSTYSPRLESFS